MIDAKELKKLIDANTARATEIANQEAYVEGKNPGILKPYPKEEPDNRIPVSFARWGINKIEGCAFKEGNITYSGDGYDEYLKEVLDRNDEGLRDLELGEIACAHGEAFELHWMENNKHCFYWLEPSQCIPIYDDSIIPRMIGFIRYWEKEGVGYANVYDSMAMQKFIKAKGKQTWEYDGIATLHPAKRVPIVHFYINRKKKNVFDHVIELIDFYDKAISENLANDMSKLSEAILALANKIDTTVDDYGVSDVDRIRQSGIMENLGDDKPVTDKIAYITKNINPEFINTSLDRIERTIKEQLAVFDENSEQFITASGVAQKFKLLGFLYAVTKITTYFSIGLQDRIALIKNYKNNLSAGENNIEYVGGRRANTDVTIDWKLNMPDDLKNIAEIVSLMGGKLSDETLVRMWPSTVVEDVDEELARLESGAPDIFAEGEGETTTESMSGTTPIENVQATALNGAQVTALQGIAQAVADNALPYETAVMLVLVAFPTIGKAMAEKMLKPADDFEPEKKEVPAALVTAQKPAMMPEAKKEEAV